MNAGLRGLHGLRRFVLILLVCCSLPAYATLITLNQAQAVVTAGSNEYTGPVTLPYHWDKRHKGLPGNAIFMLTLDLPEGEQAPYALYIPRLGNAYEVWLNGVRLDHQGDMDEFNGADHAKVPRYIALERGAVQHFNTLMILIRADVGRRGGLAPITVGPEEEVLALYGQDHRWRVTGTYVVVVLGLVVALIALLLFVTQVDNTQSGWRQYDKLYLMVAVAEFFWSIRVADAVIENPPLAWPWWGLVSVLCLGFWVVSMTLFCIDIAGWGQLSIAKRLRGWLLVSILTCPVAALVALIYGLPLVLTLWYASLAWIFVAFLPAFCLKALRSTDRAYQWLAAAMVINTAVGLRDLYAFRVSDAFVGNTWQRYTSVLFGLSLFYTILRKFNQVTIQARTLAAELEVRVAQKEAELGQSYLQLERMAREQERLAERSRILRDLHDGVGSHISSAIRQVESGSANTKEVAQTLRDSLDHLKLSIDIMNVPAGDISALLANLRYRLEPRLKAAGIKMIWEIEDLPIVEKMQASSMRELQFIVFEAISNVLQHARASQLRMVLQAKAPDGALLQIIDNGIGFEPEAVWPGHMSTMQQRANIMGAKLSVRSSPDGTTVEIWL